MEPSEIGRKFSTNEIFLSAGTTVLERTVVEALGKDFSVVFPLSYDQSQLVKAHLSFANELSGNIVIGPLVLSLLNFFFNRQSFVLPSECYIYTINKNINILTELQLVNKKFTVIDVNPCDVSPEVLIMDFTSLNCKAFVDLSNPSFIGTTTNCLKLLF